MSLPHVKALCAILLLALLPTQAHATQVEFAGPPGSGFFGAQVIVLPNGNIVVTDPHFDEGGVTNIGAAYLYDGATLALISTLKGSTANDQVGGDVTVLANGNYVVSTKVWDNGAAAGAGAVTFCSGTTGCSGLVSTSNSLVGSTAADQVGASNSGSVIGLLNGNYVVQSAKWSNGPTAHAGAATFGDGTSGTVGAITSENSVLGAVASANGSHLPFSYDAVRNRLLVGRPASNVVSILFFETTAVADGNLADGPTWSDGAPGALTNAIVPAGRTVTVSTAATIGGLSVAGGADLVMNAGLRLTGSLALGTQLNTGAHTLSLS